MFYERTHSSSTGAQYTRAGDTPYSSYSVDDEAPTSVDDGSVIVMSPSVTITSEQLEELESVIDPTQDDSQHCIIIAVREFLHSCGVW